LKLEMDRVEKAEVKQCDYFYRGTRSIRADFFKYKNE